MEDFLILGFIVLAIWLWFSALADIAHARFKSLSMNTVWLLILLFFPVLGSIVYFLLRDKLTTRKTRTFSPDFNR